MCTIEHLFSGTSVSVYYSIFFLDCNVPNKSLPFCFFVSSKNQTSPTSFLQTELGIYLIHSDVSRNIFPSFSEHKVFYKSSCSARFFFYYANTHLGIDYKYGVWTIAPGENCPSVRVRVRIGLRLGAVFLWGNCPRTISTVKNSDLIV